MNLLLKSILGLIVYAAILIGTMFGIGGNWTWIQGWIFLAIFLGVVTATFIMLIKTNPKLLEQRFGSPYQKGQSITDKIILTIITIFYISWYIIMPLDSQRYLWSYIPIYLNIIGGIGLLFALILLYGVFKQNAFLIPVVKVQKKQKVITTGLYSKVRHPMYSAVSLMFIYGALLLGSLYGLILAAILIIIFSIRIVFEEKTLTKELIGYKEYKNKVKYRMIPYIF